MKVKYLWVILLSLTFFGCDDNTGTLGLEMFPGGDQNINGKLATFDVKTQSELAGKVLQRQASAIWENLLIRISAIMRQVFWHNYIVMKTLPFRRFIIKITQTIPKRSW